MFRRLEMEGKITQPQRRCRTDCKCVVSYGYIFISPALLTSFSIVRFSLTRTTPAPIPTCTLTMATKVHLLVLIHGMWGQPSHLNALKEAIQAKHPEPNQDGEDLDILVAETNQSGATYDGIDWGGERVADEVYHTSQL